MPKPKAGQLQKPKVGQLLQRRIKQRLKDKEKRRVSDDSSDDEEPENLDDLIADAWRNTEQDLSGFDVPDDFKELDKPNCSIYTNLQYKEKDKVEIFSRSKNLWMRGEVTRVEAKKDKVKVEYYIGSNRCKKWLRFNSDHLRLCSEPADDPGDADIKSNSDGGPDDTPALKDEMSSDDEMSPLRRTDTGVSMMSSSGSPTDESGRRKHRSSVRKRKSKRKDPSKRMSRSGRDMPINKMTMSEATSQPAVDDGPTKAEIAALVQFIPSSTSGRKLLVLDSDETLIHSTFRKVADPDIIVPVQTSKGEAQCSVMQRPGMKEFLDRCSQHYEMIVFTASQRRYIQPVFERIDPDGKYFSAILCREYCSTDKTPDGQSHYVKDLKRLGRDLKDVILIDNSPQSYKYHPKNAIPIRSWFNDKEDRQLLELLPVLEGKLLKCKDVTKILDANKKSFRWVCRQQDDSSDDSDD